MSRNVVLSGNLDFLNLGDLLQLLGSNGVTGILRIKTQYKTDPGLVYMDRGNPINALAESKSGTDAILALFGWVDGDFEFTEEAISTDKKIKQGRMEIILDGLRMLDDGEIERVGAPPKKEVSAAGSGGDSLPVIKGPLIDYMYVVDEEEFADGKEIVEQEKHGNWIWVILAGVVDVVKETPKGRLTVVRLSDGAFLGSLASFTVEGNIRNASAVANGPVQLGVMDTQRLFTEFSNMPYDFKEFMLSMDRRLRQVTNRMMDLYLEKNNVAEFVKDRKPIIKQGTDTDKLYRISAGTASVVRSIKSGHVPLAHLNEGDYFGRIPFLDTGQEPASASVLAAAEGFQAEEVDVEKFQNHYAQLSSTIKKFLENLSNCISVTTMRACWFQGKLKSK